MGQTLNNRAADGQPASESYGVLVGWTHHDVNGRLDLRMQSTQSTRCGAPDEVDSHHFMMTRNQALVLANYLFSVTGQVPPRKHRRGLLGWLLGS
jgi:hypothetical protein